MVDIKENKIKEIEEEINKIEEKLPKLKLDIEQIKLEMYKDPIQDIKNYVCQKHGVIEEELLSGSRVQQIVDAKKELVFLLKNRLHYTFERIAKILNQKHHTAAIYLYNQFVNNEEKYKTKT